MTPEEVRTARFHKPPFGRRGYDEDAVDEVLDRIIDTLEGRPGITYAELSTLRFPKPLIGKRGYHENDVDSFIQRVLADGLMPR